MVKSSKGVIPVTNRPYPVKKRKRRRRVNRWLLPTCLVILILFGSIAVAAALNGQRLDKPSSSSQTVAGTSSAASTTNTTTTVTTTPSTAVTTGSAAQQPTGGAPVPESAAVEDSYFDDALFIGDSRTEGLMLYSGLQTATFYTHKGMMVSKAFTSKVIDTPSGKVTVVEALKQKQFGKIYIMLGVNELGWAYDSFFAEKYAELVDAVKAAQPQATIYIQSILPVSADKSARDKIYNNPKILNYNRLIREMVAAKGVYYVDVAAGIQDEQGCLPKDSTTDGVHLTASYCKVWLQYLKTHTVQS